MFTTTVSEIKAFWACPQRWYLQYVSPRRSPRGLSVPLTTGTIWHQFMEDLFNDVDPVTRIVVLNERFDAAVQQALDEDLSPAKIADLRKDQEKLIVAASEWAHWMQGTTLAVEKPLRLVRGDVTILGKPDRVIRLDAIQRIAHHQHKTVGGTKPIAPYLNTFHRQPHEAAYWFMLLEEYGEEPFGCLLNIMRKLTPKSIKENPQAALQQHPIPINRDMAQRALDNVLLTCNHMQQMRDIGPSLFWNNPDRDLGQFANSQDPWFEVLDTGNLEILMDDERWKDTENRYDHEEE
jgi:hypothetical protein